MTLQDWDDRFSIGVASLDEQHREMLRLLNTLYDALQEGHGQEALGDICRDLIRYATTHCTYEERLMAEFGYPQADHHYREHESFREQAHTLQQKADEGRPCVAIEVLTVLRDWLAHHINGTDRSLGAFLADKGVR